MSDYSIYLITHNHEHLPRIQKSLYPENIQLFDGTGYPSFAKLVNDCVTSCPTETIIMCSYRMTPSPVHVKKTLDLLDKGFGFVGLYLYAFFGFKKELFRKIGFFDERFVGGGYEDYDFNHRLEEADIAAYLSREVPYDSSRQTSWNYNKTRFTKELFYKKWENDREARTLKRTYPEEKYEYDIGENVETFYMPWIETYMETGFIHNRPEHWRRTFL